jgi:hypothetical protein
VPAVRRKAAGEVIARVAAGVKLVQPPRFMKTGPRIPGLDEASTPQLEEAARIEDFDFTAPLVPDESTHQAPAHRPGRVVDESLLPAVLEALDDIELVGPFAFRLRKRN